MRRQGSQKGIREDAIGSSSSVVSTEHDEGSGMVEVRTQHGGPEGLANLFTKPEDALDTEDEEINRLLIWILA